MKTLLTCSAVVAVLGLVARADDRTTISTGPVLMEGTPGLVMPVDAAGMPGGTAPMMMPQALPHYHGRGEWPGYGGCGMSCGCPSCDGTTGGMCARPRSYHLHLWDDYCYETTRCPQCGCGLGSLIHHLWCERETASCGCGCAAASCATGGYACGPHGCASIGCAGRAVEGPATMEPRQAPAGQRPTVPVPPPPVTEKKIDMKTPAKEPLKPATKKDMSSDMKTPPPADPMPKDTKEKNGKEKTSRVVPEPNSASLLDRLFPWRTRGTW